ncbi:AFR042Cp [Eremothecium gossypii ATCC 10895]|uniref:AFR042Cp n=1 Tax=Eremothecium gossypii (strain ATCC 10895 / CBS 109.51 / FGSC 9923 / NRRL Y-1056) TaxID=284811 RepID=Q754N0_EREGS|nr:AFR042Cp [Eremothecium gossypii ATCC 10895]AAS53413.2 AFR042Cp [Eremothecium gossypii ATCC 10895]AEY97725.1 FAFR042Cp [Eremothecium gossypii FDAG1]
MARPREVNPHIAEFAVLQHKPGKERALEMLQDIARRVSYLMREEGFRVGQLAEFYPRERRLLGLNVNQGARILLRLREPGDEQQFLSRETILAVMLHELTHNVFGPHDARFRRKLDELVGRQWVLDQRGIVDSFLGRGRRLGGRGRRLEGRGRRLGGRSAGVAARELAGLAAARRMAAIAATAQCCGQGGGTAPPRDGDLDVVVIDEEPCVVRTPVVIDLTNED